MVRRFHGFVGLVAIAVLASLVAGCSNGGGGSSEAAPATTGRSVDEIPVAHTPPGGFGDTFPEEVLADCSDPLVEGAPDLRGLWSVISAERSGAPVKADDSILNYRERIEQCGNRIVDMGGGTISDARADGTEANGVHDVSVFDFTTPINIIASYEGGVFVLRPVGMPQVAVTRRLDADGHMVWTRPDRGGLVATLERIGDGAGTPPNPFKMAG